MVAVNKIDSNVTGLSIAEEASPGILPGSPVWTVAEPNSYNNFGATIQTVARNPISTSRQRKKGVITDVDAAGGWNNDLTQTNMQSLLQGFMFANLRRKTEFGDGAGVITGVTTSDDRYAAASGLDDFAVGQLVFGSGFTNAGNNGLKVVDEVNAAYLGVSGNLVDEASPPAAAKLTVVGFQMGSAELEVDVSGSLPRLMRASGSVDFTDFGLVPGEFIYIGGDAAGVQFANAVNNGWARVRLIEEDAITLDKTENTMVTDAGTGKTIQLFFGRVLKNELETDIVRRTYQLERKLGAPDTAQPTQIQSEYVVGAVGNEFTMNIPTADKITVDLAFLAIDAETRDGATGPKAGTRVPLVETQAFNTSSDFSRIKLSAVSQSNGNPDPLFAFVTDMTLTLNNNCSVLKAIGRVGGFDISSGVFELSGEMTAYFSNIAAIQAVRANSDITLDFAIVAQNSGIVVDIPLITLGNAQVDIQQDQPVKIPLSLDAAQATKIDAALTHTLLMVFFDYLPNAADS